MILNDLQYQSTKKQIDGFKRQLAKLNAPEKPMTKEDRIKCQLHVDLVESFLDNFAEQIQEYEELTSWPVERQIVFEVEEIDYDLGQILVKARLAAGITQKELAERLEMTEKELQRYEDKDYQEMPLGRVIELMKGLGIGIKQKATISVERPPCL